MTHSFMSYKEIAQFIGQAVRNGRLNSISNEQKRHYKESLENDIFLKILLKEYHPFAEEWDRLLRDSAKIASRQTTSVADIHDPYFLTHKAKGVEFFVEKYGPLNMSDKVERLIEAMRVLLDSSQKVCEHRQYDFLIEQEERNRQITKARELAHKSGQTFDESMVEPSKPLETLLTGFSDYMTQSRLALPTQTVAIKELIYLGKWANEVSSQVVGESSEERLEREKESVRRWAVIIEALEESRTSYFLDTTPENYSCPMGLAERLQLKMFYIASAAHTGPLSQEQILIEKMIAPFIQKDPEALSVYHPTNLLYQEYLNAAEVFAIEDIESFWQRKDQSAVETASEYQQLFEQYEQEHRNKYHNIRNSQIVEKLLKADFNRVVANAAVGIDLLTKSDFEKLIIEKLYEKKERIVSKLVSLRDPKKSAYEIISQPEAERIILERLSASLGFSYGFTEMLLSIIGQQMMLEQQPITASLTGVALLNAYVKEERTMILQERSVGEPPHWLKDEAQRRYATYVTSYTHATASKKFSIKFLPTEQLNEDFFILIKKDLIAQSENSSQGEPYRANLLCDINFYCELIKKKKLVFKNQDHKNAMLEFFTRHHCLEGVQLVVELGHGYLHISQYLGRALSYAAEAGSVEIVKYLLKIPGTSTIFKNRDGLTPFGLAVENGHQEIVEILKPLAGGATHQCNLMGDTLLILALAGRHYDVAEYLLGYHDINVDAHNNMGETALSVAIPEAPIEMLTKLFEKQRRYLLAQKQLMTVSYIQSLFFIAANANRKDFVFFILEKCGDLIDLRKRVPGVEGDNILMHLMRKGPIYNELIRYFISRSEFNLEYRNANQDNLLMHAISYASYGIIEYLLAEKGSEIKGFHLNAQGKNAPTLAREKNYTEIAGKIQRFAQDHQALQRARGEVLFSNNPHRNFNQSLMLTVKHN